MDAFLKIFIALLLLAVVFPIVDCSSGHWTTAERARVTSHTYDPPYTTETTIYTTDPDGIMSSSQMTQYHAEEFHLDFTAQTFSGSLETNEKVYNDNPDGADIWVKRRIGGLTHGVLYNALAVSPEK